jgi:hypothetical protein
MIECYQETKLLTRGYEMGGKIEVEGAKSIAFS